VRITGGVWASRRVAGPARGTLLRPTPDALREQAFAVLGPRLPGVTFLDLFAGTGINSLEALSRGAARAVLVERATSAAALIRRNFEALAVPADRWELIVRETRQALPDLAQRGVACSSAWCDPPFVSWGDGSMALALARDLGVLLPGALVVLETPPKTEGVLPGFSLVRRMRGAFLLQLALGPTPS
jgi:16S rRNA (guanine966-N2)-methyltransferase